MSTTTTKQIPTLAECKTRFASFGECNHYHKTWIKPYKCEVKILTCKVCTKEFERRYLS